jgi:hypothetical protein
MGRGTDAAIVSWLMENGGPVIRYLTATQLIAWTSAKQRAALLQQVLDLDETQRWLNLLGAGGIHGSQDTAYENCMAKLLEFGLDHKVPAFDAKVRPYLAYVADGLDRWNGRVVAAFLVRAGYQKDERLRASVRQTLATVHKCAARGEFDVTMSGSELEALPASQRVYPFFKPDYSPLDGACRLLWVYDLYALAWYRPASREERKRIEDAISYVIDPRLLANKAAYIWNDLSRTRTAITFPRLPGFRGFDGPALTRSKLILYLELLANFYVARSSKWFWEGMGHLETYRTDRGTYIFPKEYLLERKNGYYLYAGAHMGLAERPRNQRAMEIESTFRMLRLKRQCKATTG